MDRSTSNKQGIDAKMKRARRFQINLDRSRDDKSKAYLRVQGEGRRLSEEVGSRRIIPMRRAINGLAAGGHVTNTAEGYKPSKANVESVRLAYVVEAGSRKVALPLRTKCRNQFCSCRGANPLGAA